jgi:hypothetical protein
MQRTAWLAAALTVSFGSAALAQLPPQPPPVKSPFSQGTDQERAACQPDVVKFCQAELKANQDDVFKILSCLQANRTRISAACNNVLTSHGQ